MRCASIRNLLSAQQGSPLIPAHLFFLFVNLAITHVAHVPISARAATIILLCTVL